MGLQTRSIQKLLRENFPAKTPLVVNPAQRDKWAKEIKAKLKRFDRVDTQDHGYVRQEDKERHVCTFSIKRDTMTGVIAATGSLPSAGSTSRSMAFICRSRATTSIGQSRCKVVILAPRDEV